MVNNNKPKREQKLIEEIFNSITHGLGAIAGIIGLVIGVITLASPVSFKVGFIIYCASLIILMLISTLYHALSFTKAKGVFRVLDHSSIFLLIAGSFTPFIIYLYKGLAMAMILAAVWLLAVIGITITVLFVMPRSWKKTGVFLYLAFGWLALVFIPKISMIHTSVIWLLFIGGILYTVGTVPFALKKPFTHVSWHFFVLAAACVQFLAIIKLN